MPSRVFAQRPTPCVGIKYNDMMSLLFVHLQGNGQFDLKTLALYTICVNDQKTNISFYRLHNMKVDYKLSTE